MAVKSVVVKTRKISNVAGNITYLSDRKDHPETCITKASCDLQLWLEYARVNREAFRRSNQKGKCVEARELIFVCPNEFYRMPAEKREQFLEVMVEALRKKFGTEIYAALHAADQEEKNMHVHVMYMERTKHIKNEKVATRRLYFDDQGRQVKSKKYAVDESGQLLPGYHFVKTGEVYGEVEWTAKNKNLRAKDFTAEMKQWWAGQINFIRDMDRPWSHGLEKRVVYDRENSPYLPLQSYKAPLKYSDPDTQATAVRDCEENEMAADIRECNELRKQYNLLVDGAINAGADLKELVDMRKRVSASIFNAVQNGYAKKVLHAGIDWLIRFKTKLKAQLMPQSDKNSPLDDKIRKGREISLQQKKPLKNKNNELEI